MTNFLDFFTANESVEETHSWTLNSHLHSSSLDSLAQILADEIVAFRCRSCSYLYNAWKGRVQDGSPLTDSQQKALETFIKPVFGLRACPDHVPIHHIEGYVGEMIWYFFVKEIPSEETIVRIEPPSFKVTDPGGDGMIVHRLPAGYLMFRLWEMKKCTGATATISGTVNEAYNQLTNNAVEYLARYTTIAQETDDEELSDFYGQLIELWYAASPKAAAGISIATSAAHVPGECFTTFGSQFPQFVTPRRLKGMLTAVDDFTEFALRVRECIWTGL